MSHLAFSGDCFSSCGHCPFSSFGPGELLGFPTWFSCYLPHFLLSPQCPRSWYFEYAPTSPSISFSWLQISILLTENNNTKKNKKKTTSGLAKTQGMILESSLFLTLSIQSISLWSRLNFQNLSLLHPPLSSAFSFLSWPYHLSPGFLDSIFLRNSGKIIFK